MAARRPYWCILGISVGCLGAGSCIAPDVQRLLPDWNRVVIVDREYFITFPFSQPSEDTEPKFLTAPTSAFWRKLSDLEAVQREHWDAKSTAILVYPLAAHGPELSRVMELMREARIIAMLSKTALEDLQTPEYLAVLNSLPDPPE